MSEWRSWARWDNTTGCTERFQVEDDHADEVRLVGVAVHEHLRDVGAAGEHALQLLRTARM